MLLLFNYYNLYNMLAKTSIAVFALLTSNVNAAQAQVKDISLLSLNE